MNFPKEMQDQSVYDFNAIAAGSEGEIYRVLQL